MIMVHYIRLLIDVMLCTLLAGVFNFLVSFLFLKSVASDRYEGVLALGVQDLQIAGCFLVLFEQLFLCDFAEFLSILDSLHERYFVGGFAFCAFPQAADAIDGRKSLESLAEVRLIGLT